MNKSSSVMLFAQGGLLVMSLLFVPDIFREGLTRDNLFTIFMLLGSLTLVSTYATNIFTNTLNHEDYNKVYPLPVRRRWSWINTVIQALCILSFLLTFYYIMTHFNDELSWKLLCPAWILLCLYNIYREWQQRRHLITQ